MAGLNFFPFCGFSFQNKQEERQMREKFLREAQYSRGKYWKSVFKLENPNHFILFFNASNITAQKSTHNY